MRVHLEAHLLFESPAALPRCLQSMGAEHQFQLLLGPLNAYETGLMVRFSGVGIYPWRSAVKA